MNTIAAQAIGGRYRLLDQLGQGGMGIVYRAYDRLAHQHIALKQVKAPPEKLRLNSLRSDPLLALAQEFRLLASLRHPHIVAVLDYGFDAHQLPYYTMELLEAAQTITAYGRTLAADGKTRLLIEMLQALVYLHRRGVIHCDLKPANVLVAQDGKVRVMDFGLALQPSTSESANSQVFGTIAYMAPELFTESPASRASDLYAVGVLLYELFAGKHPYSADNPAITLYNLMNRPIDLELLPPRLVGLAARLLQKTPAYRPQYAEEVIAELCQAMDISYPAESLTVRESFLQASAFVGRERELATLTEVLNTTLHGDCDFWLVGGESGVGKSRLVDELRTQALVSGALVLRGQGITEGGRPYQLWWEIARRLLLETPLTDFEAGVLKPLVPDISSLLGHDVPDLPELAGAAGQQRLASTLVAVLKRLPTPLVLLLEDLQWADESLFPLRQILMVRDQLKHLLVIGTYRDDERPGLPQELEGMQVLKLRRLNAKAIEQLTRVMLGDTREPSEVVELLRRETEGNV
ncbi:MAG TPA: serine/threonine-protein kinase, partial [Phototrophicaceae bacterium]|nr:serine/threonine-protein kinase [Phototrophicaceae bacterium]